MRWLVATALRLRVAVVVLALGFALAAWRVVRVAPFDVFPEFAPPLAEIQTEAPGLSTEEVEALITLPIEQDLNGTPFLETIRSKSVLGLSSVVLIFQRGTDIHRARQFVSERLARLGTTLPAVARPPVLLSPLSSTSRVLKIGLSSTTLSQTELTTLARWTIRPRLIAVPGVANVAIWGQRDRQLQVLVDPDRLAANGVGLAEVTAAAGAAVAVEGGGFIDLPNQRMAVSQRPTVAAAADLAQAVVTSRKGASITLGDVADVVEGNAPPIGDAVIDDGPGLLLIVEKQPWGNTLEVTRGVEAALETLRPALAEVRVDPTIFRPATFIEMALGNLNRALLIGAVLVVVVLIAFLRDWRTAAISLVAMPLSLLAAALVIRYQGGLLDTMVLAGLVIALGEVVDDAIIDVENIVRRLRLNEAAGRPRSAFQVVLEASLEVRSAVVYATLIVALVFMPVFFLGGLAGTFFRPLALSYVAAIVASLLVALIITPALALLLLPGRTDRRREPPLVGRLKAWYLARLGPAVDRPGRATLWLGGTTLAAAAIALLLGQEFLPHFKEYDFLMHFVEKPGTSIDAMRRVTLRASRDLRAVPGVRNFGAHIGRAEVADEVVGPNFTELWISVDAEVEYDATVARIQAVVDAYPGLYRDVLTYLRERIKEVLTGTSASLVVRIYGPELAGLRRHAEAVAAAIREVSGVVDLKVQPQVLVPQVEVAIRPAAARSFGLTERAIRHQVGSLVRGLKVGQVYQANTVADVVVWGVPRLRTDPSALGAIPIEIPGGGHVALGDVADVRVSPTPNDITREHASRRLDVTANVGGRSLSAVAGEVERAVAGLSFEPGYHPEVLGEYAAQREARRQLAGLAILALIGVWLVLYIDFGSARTAGLVFASLPFALAGAVLAVLLTGATLSLGSLVGFVTVLGIAARNGIMLVSHFGHLERQEGQAFGRELVLRGASERLVPVLMTALVTALALVPLVATGSRPGQEIEHPMAIVILGGLVSSTLLNLLFMPALYLRYGRSAGLAIEPSRGSG
jgi:CzcA family heavy metal efflux pump